MSDIDELRARRLRELQSLQQQNSMQEGVQNQFRQQEMEAQIKSVMQQILSPEAQSRLTNIRLARPDFARQIEVLLIQLYQSGRLTKLSDDQLKALLSKIKGEQRETKIQVR